MPVVDWCGFRSLPVRVDEPSVGEGGRDCEVTDAGIDHLRAVLPQAMQMDARSSPLAHPPTAAVSEPAADVAPTALAPARKRRLVRSHRRSISTTLLFEIPFAQSGSWLWRSPSASAADPATIRANHGSARRTIADGRGVGQVVLARWLAARRRGLRSTLTLDLEPSSFLPRRRRRRCACPPGERGLAPPAICCSLPRLPAASAS